MFKTHHLQSSTSIGNTFATLLQSQVGGWYLFNHKSTFGFTRWSIHAFKSERGYPVK